MLVEFRHRSWLDEDNRAETLSFLERIGAAYVTVDAPQSDTAKNLVPTVPAVTAGTAYVRFHGRNLGTWNKRGGSAAERFDYLYSDEELGEWTGTLKELAGAVERGVRVLQQQRDVAGSGEPARPDLAGGDERAPAANAARPQRQSRRPAGRRRRVRAMNVLSVIHGDDARTELFAPAIAEGGHSLDEWSFSWGTPPPRPLESYDAVLVFGGAMHADHDDAHPWLAPETRWLEQLLASGTPVLGICLGVQLLARAAGAWVGPLPEPEIGWCRRRADRRRRRRSRARRAAANVLGAAVAPLHVRRARGRGRAGAKRGVHAGVPARRGVLGRAVPSRGDAVAARRLDRRHDRSCRPIPTRLRAETVEHIAQWNELGRTLCAAFLDAAARVLERAA